LLTLVLTCLGEIVVVITEPGLEIAFGRGGNATDFQIGEWYDPEDGFTFTRGQTSALRLPFQEAPCGLILEAEVQPFVRPPSLCHQRLVARINGRVVGSAALEERTVVGFWVPPELTRREMTLIFEHADAARPSEVCGAADTRCLAVRLHTIRTYLVGRQDARPWSPRSPATVRLAERSDAKGAMSELCQKFGISAADLSMRFESLGDNCEFGLVQRMCNAEPLGLFRFAGGYLPEIIRGLNSGFSGLGDPEKVTPKTEADGTEWMIYEDSYLLRYHTFVHLENATAQEMRVREVKKLAFLKEKLLRDLTTGEKIFIYKRTQRPLPFEEALPLFRALCGQGVNSLLWVVPASNGYEPGTVEEVLPGLFRGHIERLAPPATPVDQSFVGWLEVCAAALQLSLSSRPSTVVGRPEVPCFV
jgi:hypothetical protein